MANYLPNGKIYFDEKFVEWVWDKKKLATTRFLQGEPELGKLKKGDKVRAITEAGLTFAVLLIKDTECKKYSEIDDTLAKIENMSRKDLLAALTFYYPTIKDDDEVFIIYYDVIQNVYLIDSDESSKKHSITKIDFDEKFLDRVRKNLPNRKIYFDEKFVEWVWDKKKLATTRFLKAESELGELKKGDKIRAVTDTGLTFAVLLITHTEYKKYSEIDNKLAKTENMSRKDLLAALKFYYPSIKSDDEVFIIYYDVIQNLYLIDSDASSEKPTSITKIEFDDKFVEWVWKRKKLATTRFLEDQPELSQLKKGDKVIAVADSGMPFAVLFITNTERRKFSEVDEELAKIENMTKENLLAVLKFYSPTIKDNDEIFIIYYNVEKNIYPSKI